MENVITPTGPLGFQVSALGKAENGLIADFASLAEAEAFVVSMRRLDAGRTHLMDDFKRAELMAKEPGAPIGDWHPADVIAELKKRGHSLAALAIANGYHPTSAGKALKKSWPAMEQIIAEACWCGA